MSLKRIRAAWRRGGGLVAGGVALDLVADRWWERRCGIDAAGLVRIETLVTEWRGLHDYFPTSRRVFRALMGHVEIRPREDVFVDFGSGKGRALILAAQYPFKRVVGVEISEALSRSARANVAAWPGRFTCPDIEITTDDAAAYGIPSDGTVMYFYNPFHGPVLRAVFEAIARSRACRPRPVWVVFNNTSHFRAMEREFAWLRPIARPVYEHECAVYQAV